MIINFWYYANIPLRVIRAARCPLCPAHSCLVVSLCGCLASLRGGDIIESLWSLDVSVASLRGCVASL